MVSVIVWHRPTLIISVTVDVYAGNSINQQMTAMLSQHNDTDILEIIGRLDIEADDTMR